jgi:hypothetical protein
VVTIKATAFCGALRCNLVNHHHHFGRSAAFLFRLDKSSLIIEASAHKSLDNLPDYTVFTLKTVLLILFRSPDTSGVAMIMKGCP